MTEAAANTPLPGGPQTSAWEPRAATAAAAPVLSVQGFEGPLDWLLELARAQRIDLARLPIADLIQSFAAALDIALARPDGRAPPLERWADWLVMAATLTHLRSRLLLPADAPEARTAAGEAEALRRRLAAREQMRVSADWLERRPQLGREVFARGCPESNANTHAADITELLRACLVQLRVPEQLAANYRLRSRPFWRVSDAIAHIERMLPEVPPDSPLAAFLPRIDPHEPGRELRCRAAVASTLVAGLELARNAGLLLRQGDPWTPIHVGRQEEGRLA